MHLTPALDPTWLCSMVHLSPCKGDNNHPSLLFWPLHILNAEQWCLLISDHVSVFCLFMCRHALCCPLDLHKSVFFIHTYFHEVFGGNIYIHIYMRIQCTCSIWIWLLLYFYYFLTLRSLVYLKASYHCHYISYLQHLNCTRFNNVFCLWNILYILIKTHVIGIWLSTFTELNMFCINNRKMFLISIHKRYLN